MAGRKCTITEEALGRLEMAFRFGMTITAACAHAGITLDAYHRYAKKHPAFRDNVRVWQKTPIANSYINIAKSIEKGDVEVSKWALKEERLKAETRERIKTLRAQRQSTDNIALNGVEINLIDAINEVDQKTTGEGDAA